MKKILSILKSFVSEIPYKNISVYLSFGATVLALVASIVFASPEITQATDLRGYFDASNNINLTLAIIAIAIVVLLSLSKYTLLYGKIFSWALVFTNFLIYAKTIYMYFAGVFYNGFTPDAVQKIDKGCLVSIILFLVASILGNVAIYLFNGKKVAKNVVEEN